MQLRLFVDNSEVDILDEPEGLSGLNITYERTKYMGLSTKIDVKLVFYCSSGKEALDAEFESKFVNGNAYIIISDECGGTEIETKFLLDFRTYEADDNSTKLGLKEDNDVNRWDDKEDTLIELTDEELVLVRNTINNYSYLANEGVIENEDLNEFFEVGQPFITPNNIVPLHYNAITTFYNYNTIQNDLENGNDLDSNYFVEKRNISLNQLPSTADVQFFSNAILDTLPSHVRYTNFEPYPFFENELENGTLEIKISGNRSAEITADEFNPFFETQSITQPRKALNIQNKLAYEFIVIGTTFERPRNILINRINDIDSLFVPPSLTPILNATHTMVTNLNNDFEVEKEVRKGEKVWYFKMHLWLASEQAGVPLPETYFSIKLFSGDYKITSQEQIEAKFLTTNLATENVLTPLNVFFNSYPTNAIKASSIATQLFENLNPIALETHFDDLYLTNGEMIRNRTNRQSLKMKPKDFYENLNKLIPIGIGMNYSGTPELQMLTYEELYENTVFKTFNDADFISEVKVSIAENMLYNEVEVGYSDFKESNEELHRKNSYVINGGRGNGKLNLVTDWLASKYLFKKAKNESREQEGKEYDNKIFILSIEEAFGLKITKSQNNNNTAPLFDNVFEDPDNALGLNRRYSTVINLINQKFRWGLSFWKSINGLSPTNETVYTKDLEYAGTYHDYLDGFPISANNTFNATLTHVTQVLPKYIEFSLVMSVIQFYEIRKNWYKSIQVIGNKTYKGNIIEARYSNGVVSFKLLERF